MKQADPDKEIVIKGKSLKGEKKRVARELKRMFATTRVLRVKDLASQLNLNGLKLREYINT
ncbi:MAG: hypothetical protein ACTSUE_25935 [Promethearchaeota archaeon]